MDVMDSIMELDLIGLVSLGGIRYRAPYLRICKYNQYSTIQHNSINANIRIGKVAMKPLHMKRDPKLWGVEGKESCFPSEQEEEEEEEEGESSRQLV